MRRQTEMAIIDADVTLMVVDAKAGVTPVDSFANEIRKAGYVLFCLPTNVRARLEQLVWLRHGHWGLASLSLSQPRMVRGWRICMMRCLQP